jgi:Holliday junction resolvasome RuvABC endonuclease subunit
MYKPKRKLIQHRILAIDPGSRELGYAVLFDREIVASGVKDMRHFRPLGVLLEKTRELVRDLCDRYEIETIAAEETFFRNNKNTLALVAQGEDIKKFAKELGLHVVTYSARAARKRVVGTGAATKAEVAEGLCALYPELRIHTNNNRRWKDKWWHNLFDALAVGLAFVYDEEREGGMRSKKVA